MAARDAVIVSTARTPIGRAYKGAFNATPGATLGALSLAPAIERAGIEAGEIDDVVWGCVLTQGTQAGNIGRQVALRAGCPVTVSAQTIDRQCASGLMAIATAAKQVIIDRMDIVAAGGQDSISMVQTPEMRIAPDPSLNWLALPAVMWVPGPSTGWSAARPSSVVSARLPSSLASVTSFCETSPVSLSLMLIVTVTGTISASKRPSACAAAVRCCD